MEKEVKKLTWETTFDTASKTMTHIFNDRVCVILDFNFQIITTAQDGEPIDKFEITGMTVDEYETFLLGIAKSAEQLKYSGNV